MANSNDPEHAATVNIRYRLIPDNTGADGQLLSDLQTNEDSRRAAQAKGEGAADIARDDRSVLNKLMGALNQNTSTLTGQDKKTAELTKFIGEQFDKISNTLMKGVNMSFDVIDGIYKEMKKSSPLLQTLESLFNLAMQLFFMPLGNKLAETLIPAVIKMVEKAVAFWDEIGDGNLGAIMVKAVDYGIKMIGDFFKDTGSLLKTQGGILGSIGRFLEKIGDFIKGDMLNLLSKMLDVVGFVIDNLGHILAAIIAFKVASIATRILTTTAIITADTKAFGTSVGTAAGLGILATAGAWLGAESYLSSPGHADGGFVPHTPGGRLITVAENEGEYIVPKSKMGMGGNVTNNFYGYTSDDIREMIDRSVSDKISMSYIKGGY